MDTNKPCKCCQHVYFIIKAHTHIYIYKHGMIYTSLIGRGKIVYMIVKCT